MKVFITGANGFVGHWLMEWLTSCGDEVYCLPSDVDINDEDRLEKEVEKVSPDAFYHLAALSHVGDSWGNPKAVFKVNALGTLNVTEVLKRACPSARLLLVSSAEVYGKVSEIDLPITESLDIKPSTPYAASKVAAEYIGLQAATTGLDVVIVRPFNHVGPGQSDKFVVAALAKRIIEAKKLNKGYISVGNLSSKRDYTDVRSVVKCYRQLITGGKTGEIYNVCSGIARSVSDIAFRLMELAGVTIEFRIDQNLARGSDVPVLVGDATKVRQATGWQVDVDFDRTLEDILNFWDQKKVD